MTRTAAIEETKTIVVEYEIKRPPAAVWRALTEPHLLARWLMENDIRAEVGHRFTFRAPPVAGWDGVVQCQVLEVDAPRRLRYSWRGGSDDRQGYGERIDTTVTWTLTATEGGGTLLRLEHAGFTEKNAFAYENLAKGWRGKLAARIEGILNGD
jgi:uncharacterized protein YndB with AHSA1/START domain